MAYGTVALYFALIASGVREEDETLAQTCSFCASSNPIKYLGAKPIFIDCGKEIWNMSPELLEEAIKDCIVKNSRET